MPAETVSLRFVFRAIAMVELLTIMEHEKLWEKHGVNVQFDFSKGPLECEERLFSGDVDFILGNHVTPYMRLAQGYPMVCLAQSVNYDHLWLATRPETTELPTLTGGCIVGRPLIRPDGAFNGHDTLTRGLFLRMQGVDIFKLTWLDGLGRGSSAAFDAVLNRDADACFVNPRGADAAREAGLTIHEFPPFPMIHNLTLTSMLPWVQREPETAKRVIRVIMDATDYFVANREETLDMLRNPVHPLPEGYADDLAERYDERIEEYSRTLFPEPEAIVNVHRLSTMVYPEAERVNPLELWDLRLLREVHLERKQSTA